MYSCQNYNKSTFVATGFSAVVPANGTLTFGTTQRITGDAIEMGTNNTTVNLKRPRSLSSNCKCNSRRCC